jgi:hypothetical protein
MPNATIENMTFELFYTHDQLRDNKFSQLSSGGKVEWLRLRMQMIFIEPLNRLLDRNSVAWKTLNSHAEEEDPRRTVDIASFSILLNGVEALGSFLFPPNRNKQRNFFRFIKDYMPDWNVVVQGTTHTTKDMPYILWQHFRNGIAHAFVIELGGIEFSLSSRWEVQDGVLAINPKKFYDDFLVGQVKFFEDIKNVQNPKHNVFLERFRDAYPH